MIQYCDDLIICQVIYEGWQVEYLYDVSGLVFYCNCVGQVSVEEIYWIFGIVLQFFFVVVFSIEEWLESFVGWYVLECDNIYDFNQ